MKASILVLLTSIFFVSVMGCMHMDGVPYAITEPECRLGKLESLYEFAGVHFMFYNNSERPIQSFNFSCLVFDSDGEQSPFIGSNIISARYQESIEAHSNQEIVLSLDSYISHIPEEPYIIDFFYIIAIEYADGSAWEDPYGKLIPGAL